MPGPQNNPPPAPSDLWTALYEQLKTELNTQQFNAVVLFQRAFQKPGASPKDIASGINFVLDTGISATVADEIIKASGLTQQQVSDAFKIVFPGIDFGTIGNQIPSIADSLLKAEFASLGPFTPATGFINTGERLSAWLRANSRPDAPLNPISPWECRLGAAKFFVPPTSIDVQKSFKTGMGQGALRAINTPKFNSGHVETVIRMKLFFPSNQDIWGFEGNTISIDFDNDPDVVIDAFLSSLRGLVTQFKYAPFLPVKNAYLNQVWGVDAVALESLTISVVPDFPFCIQADLVMNRFNYDAYLPQISNFEAAIHWGRYRQYMGRAAYQLASVVDKNFTSMTTAQDNQAASSSMLDPAHPDPPVGNSAPKNVYAFNKIQEWQDGKAFDFFYPAFDPAPVIGPNVSNLQKPDDDGTNTTNQNRGWWDNLLGTLGVNIDSNPLASFDNAARAANGTPVQGQQTVDNSLTGNSFGLVTNWMKNLGLAFIDMDQSHLGDLINHQVAVLKAANPGVSEATIVGMKQNIEGAWWATLYKNFLSDPTLQAVLNLQARRRGWISAKEWDIPMEELGLDPNNVIVQNVSVNIGNNLARLQLSMQDEPTYQHIGGLDTRLSISMIIFNEADLLKFRTMYETIDGYSRLENGHFVLGFLGIKNVVAALCGMKYCIPVSMDTETIPNFPHCYKVTIEVVDFDVFQQKREFISSDQQKELIDAFGKRNPFLRLQQLWGAFNAYPDLPLAVRDENSKIIGHLDPDYYFRAFEPIDSDLMNFTDSHNNPDVIADHTINVHFGNITADSGQSQVIQQDPNGFHYVSGGKTIAGGISYNDVHAGVLVKSPNVDTSIPGVTIPLSPASAYTQPYIDQNKNDPIDQLQHMLNDTAYRANTGRMVRAFPTYMLWLIDEGGKYLGAKLFDNFYGLQSVIDISTIASEDAIGDTAVIRISNLYSRLSTQIKDYFDPDLIATADIINSTISTFRNLASGTSNYLVNLDTVKLVPGVRIHLRMGYGANPNALDTVFNGVITGVETGDVITITAQSDAIELSAITNNTNKNGDSGKIDGSMMSGLWMSEPRDLMVRLLTMGSSTFRDVISHASLGRIFSENKYGIRHFGAILYDYMGERERVKHEGLIGAAGLGLSQLGQDVTGAFAGAAVGSINTGVFNLMSSLWANFATRRDYEVFKRNIYPGNGIGLAQYLGGDIGDGGVQNGFAPTGVNPAGTIIHPLTGQVIQPDSVDPRIILNQAANAVTSDPNNPGIAQAIQENPLIAPALQNSGQSPVTELWSPVKQFAGATHSFLSAMGITHREGTGGDLAGFHQVSFRADTYMRSVWDLFLSCAALLPNYIVAVRPFMDRSTVFYGKPHWMYTSGVIPVSLGVADNDPSAPQLSAPDDQVEQILQQVGVAQDATETPDDFYNRLTSISNGVASGSIDPNGTTLGVIYNGQDPNSLPLHHPSNTAGTDIPFRTGGMGMEMHIPTDSSLTKDVQQHKHVTNVPEQFQHPFYMDRVGGGVGGRSGTNNYAPNSTIMAGDDPNKPGAGAAIWGQSMPPDLEEYYVAFPWPYGRGGSDAGKAKDTLKKAKVLVYNTLTKLACVCSPGDWGPSDDVIAKGIVGGMSPETWYATGNSARGTKYIFGYVDDTTPVGPWTGAKSVSGTTGSNQTDAARDALYGKTPIGAPVAPTTTPSGLPNVSNIAPGSGPQGLTSGDIQVNFALAKPGTVPGWMKPSGANAKDAPLIHALTTLEPDAQLFSFKFGWMLNNVPVNYTDPATGFVDVVGTSAQEVFQKGTNQKVPFAPAGRSNSDAVSVWNQFRKQWPDGLQQVIDVFHSVYPKDVISTNDTDYANFADLSVIENYAALVASPGQGSISDRIKNTTGISDEIKQQLLAKDKEFQQYKDTDPRYAYFATIVSFMEFMWQNSYNRGWLVQVANRTEDNILDIGAFVKDVGKFSENIPVVNFLSAPIEDVGQVLHDVSNTIGDVIGAVGTAIDAVGAVGDVISGFLGGGGGGKPKTSAAGAPLASGGKGGSWDFTDKPLKAWEKFITAGPDSATEYMIANSAAGSDATSPISNGIADFKADVIDPITGVISNTVKGIGAVASGIVSLIRGGIMAVSYGLGMSGLMQQQANLLNGFLNDSLYYETKYGVGSLMYLVDNPFTREYGEPVVEIREPFQRVHFISSFQHIIHNGIVENLDGVATVITATSNGQHPVSVYFDKGSPTELQVEKTVDTGLRWDRPRALTAVFHPTQLIRGFIKDAEGSSDKISSKRVALWHLKESLKDIYGGEVLIIGQPDIRPHDLVYLGDMYEKMAGLVEVEQVIHHFTPEMGYVTSITPNAIVSINDPGRWSFMNMAKSIWDHVMLRSSFRGAFGIKFGTNVTGGIRGLPANIDVNTLTQIAQTNLNTAIHYTGGSSQVIKDFSDGIGLGMFTGSLGPVGAALGPLSGIISGGIFDYVQKKLVDQHGCYIQYLTRNQEPMDAGLTYNHGVAVGQQPGITMFRNSLRLPIPLDQAGHSGTITTNDLLSNLGWNTLSETDLYKDSDLFTNQINAQISKLTNRQPDAVPFIKSEVDWVTVTAIIDDISFLVAETNIAPNGVVLGAITSAGRISVAEEATKAYLQQILIDGPKDAGFNPSLAIRVNPTKRLDAQGRLIAWAFINAPTTVAEAQAAGLNVGADATDSEAFRKDFLTQLAGAWPQVEWDGYLPDGRPFTANWDLVLHGFADVDQSVFSYAVPGTGVQGTR